MKKLIFMCMLVTLVGCGSTSGRLGDLPSVTDKATAAKVVTVRISSFVGAANGYIVALNGKDLFGIGSGEHAEFFLSPGEHYITVKCFGGWSPTWKEESLKFDAKALETTYFRIGPSGRCAEIALSIQGDVAKDLSISKRVDLKERVAQ
jgi:hypothetical protein